MSISIGIDGALSILPVALFSPPQIVNANPNPPPSIYLGISVWDNSIASSADDITAVYQEAVAPILPTETGPPPLTLATPQQVRAGTDAADAITPAALAQSATPQVLPASGLISWDMSLGYNATVTLTSSALFSTPSNPIVGWTYVLTVIQGGSGGYTMTWPIIFNFGSAGAPTLSLTAGKRDIVTLYCTSAGASPAFIATAATGF